MSRKGLLYYLFSKNKKPYYRDANGIIKEGDDNYMKPDGQPAILLTDPDGWDETLVKYARNINYWGLFREMTVPIKLVDDGFDIIEHVMWNEGFAKGLCYLGMRNLDRINLPYRYRKFYFSELNLCKYRRDENTATVEALEGGLGKIIKANENTKFTLNVSDDPEKITILNDGVALYGRKTYLLGPVDYNANAYLFFSLLATELAEEGKSTGISLFESGYEDMFLFDDYLTNSSNYIAKANESNTTSIDIKFKGSFKLKLVDYRDQFFCRIRFVVSPVATPTIIQYVDIYNPSTGTPNDPPFTFEGEVKDIVFDRTITLNPGDRVFIHMELSFGTGFGDASDWAILDGGKMEIEFVNRFRSSYTDGLRPKRVCEKLLEKMIDASGKPLLTNDNIFLISEFLTNLNDCFITSIDLIRGIENGVIKTSFKDFFKSMNHFSVAMGVEQDNKMLFELFKDFFKPDLIADLGEGSKPDLQVAEDLLFNAIKVGGPTVDYNDVNGKNEFNQGQVWSNPITDVVKELDLSTPYRRDSIGMELARIELAGKPTTDSEGDSDVCMINIETVEQTDPDGIKYYKIYRPVYASVEGIINIEGIYNTEYTPVHTILNNGQYIRSVLDKLDSDFLIQSSFDKNVEFKTVGVRTVSQKEPIKIGGLGDKIFLPYYVNNTTETAIEVFNILNTNPYGRIRMTVNGRAFYFWMFDGGLKPEPNQKQSWKMLSTFENNFKNFYKPA